MLLTHSPIETPTGRGVCDGYLNREVSNQLVGLALVSFFHRGSSYLNTHSTQRKRQAFFWLDMCGRRLIEDLVRKHRRSVSVAATSKKMHWTLSSCDVVSGFESEWAEDLEFE